MSSTNPILCRICLCDNTLGRFISPCRCNGTMKYVHDHCLQQWRMYSKNPNSFFRCDQCKHNYSFRKSWLIDVVKNDYLVYFNTALLFFSICVLCIYFSQWLGCIKSYKGEPSLFLSISITFHVLLRIILQSPHVRGTLFINVLCKLVLWYSIYKTYKLVQYLMNTFIVPYIITRCLSQEEYRLENVS